MPQFCVTFTEVECYCGIRSCGVHPTDILRRFSRFVDRTLDFCDTSEELEPNDFYAKAAVTNKCACNEIDAS